MNVIQDVSPGKDKTIVISPLSLWERVRVREALKGGNSSWLCNRVNSYQIKVTMYRQVVFVLIHQRHVSI